MNSLDSLSVREKAMICCDMATWTAWSHATNTFSPNTPQTEASFTALELNFSELNSSSRRTPVQTVLLECACLELSNLVRCSAFIANQ